MSAFPFSFASAPPPTVAVEIGALRVSAATLEMRSGRPTIAAHALEPLPAGALVPSLTGRNALDRATVITALNRVLERLGRPRRVGLVVPDPVAKVSLIRFAHVPTRSADLDQLIRWQVRKAAPFPIQDAQVGYVPGSAGADGQEFIVTMARRDVVEEYEELCAEAGARAGLVDISTFNVVNAVLGGSAPPPEADWLLVNVAADCSSIAILRGPHLIFFRSRTADADGSLEELVHQTAMYYEDRLKGGGFMRVLLCGASTAAARQTADAELIRRSLEERLAMPVETVDVRETATLTDRIMAAPALLDALAPLVGLLVRGYGD